MEAEELATVINLPEDNIDELREALASDDPIAAVAAINDRNSKKLVAQTMEHMPIRNCAQLAAILLRLPTREPSRESDTMWVWMKGDGVVRFSFNPEFTVQRDEDERLYVVCHEAEHVINAHLQRDYALPNDEYWKIACEAMINYRLCRRLNMPKVPAGGVDPNKIYEGYAKKERELGREPVNIADFYASDVDVYKYLKRTQPVYRNLQLCSLGGGADQNQCPTCGGEGEVAAPQTGQGQSQSQSQNSQGQSGQDDQDDQGQHDKGQSGQNGQGQSGQDDQGQHDKGQSGQNGQADGHGDGKMPCPTCQGSGQNPNGHPYDPETLGSLVENTIRQGIARALAGDTQVRAELEELAAVTPEASKLWGDLGLGALRGETDKGRAHSMWAHLMRDALASRLSDDEGRPAYSRKTGHFPTANPRLGNPLAPVGREEQRFALIAVDTSGSMPQHILDRIGRMVGQIPNCEARWLWWDAEAYEFQPGDGIMGGGGTTTQSVTRWIDSELIANGEDFPDVVIMVTDGHVGSEDQNYPYPYPERWIWLITSGGNTWPHQKGMKMIEVDDLSSVAA